VKNKGNHKIGISLDDLPDNLVKLINELTDDKNFPEKHSARIALVKLGKPIIPYMHRLLSRAARSGQFDPQKSYGLPYSARRS
jgi:hypothetical protein